MTRDQERMISKALDNVGDLSDWEREFIEKLAAFHVCWELSEKQDQILQRINTKLTRLLQKRIEATMADLGVPQ